MTFREECKLLTAASLVWLLLLPGCVTERQRVLLAQRPRNCVFSPADNKSVPLAEGQAYAFAEFDASEGMSAVILRLAGDAVLSKRYHEEHDMTLLASSGSAIVIVEQTRYHVTPGTAVFLPRMTAYTIIPADGQEEFTAVLVFSPRFDGTDVVLER